ncbi:molybdopterin-dependent oxidoreductase [Dyella sp. LX-66]|uniref:nitrate reductase n=1 Tax=unclassified Dyella TaxID=2634549 RepID=UPI001BE0F160|nr:MULTISPECIES: nitrate reductase [unclassified Dyella]MBT2117083.1 molybdopterin-dependent oxidoreductase [Dyella sp. LX-1]MBT2139841.1 molybdopterin-dependent oxidoreductase [Dyella sp. LX-66]
MSEAVRTTCPYCGVGCGVLASVDADGAARVAGDPAHASNRGRLCVKGSALGDTVGMEGRLLHPLLREADGVVRRAGWDEAIQRVADGFSRVVAEHGPDAVAFYVSGQLLTEDYYVVNKLAKGYLGTANIDTNSRLCMSSAVAGHKRAFGEDVVPGCYEDLEQAELVVLVGSNTAWCHPVLFQRVTQARDGRDGPRVVVIDPRFTATCEGADLHLPIRPGTDVRLFNGLLSFLFRHGVIDPAFIDAHTEGFDAALAAAEAEAGDPAQVAQQCGLQAADVVAFYRLFARHEKVVTLFSQGVNQSSSGTDKVNAIINCHLATARIGRPGMGPFSITGQPNAMGGREVGGLANMLAAHMELGEPAHRDIVQAFWQSPRMADKPGLKAVELFDAVGEGRIKALWIMATNPAVSLPEADKVRAALARCELVVCSDIVERTDTNAYAHVLLPALGWGEKDGTVTSSERRISRQRPFLPAPGEARADWRVVCEVARRMGFERGFEFGNPHEIFVEHAQLTTFRNREPAADGVPAAYRRLHLGSLARLDRQAYDTLAPVQWPVTEAGEGTPRLFADGRFSHAHGRARFVITASRPPVHAVDREYPLVLNTGRIRDQWHTMTRTARSPRLNGHIGEPFIDMHPHDALRCGVREGTLARVSSRWGAMVGRVRHGGGILAGQVFVPIHWSDQFASDACVGGVVNPAVDPVSGEPEFKHTPVRVEPFAVRWYGFALARQALPASALSYWTLIRGDRFLRYELAHRERPADCDAWAKGWLGATETGADWLAFEDRETGVYRAVHLRDGRIESCLFLAAQPHLPSRQWLSSLFALERLDEADRLALLSGEPPGGGGDPGPVVCSCFGVGRNTILDAIRANDLDLPAQITAELRAGGNCGSCIPELRRLIAETRAVTAA